MYLTSEPYRFIVGAELVIVGQVLNYGVYKALGKNGVYYGVKLGRPIPWVNGFPFNVVSHPQYVGTAATIWGLVILAASQAHIESGIVTLCLIWNSYYIFTSIIEDYY